MTLYLHGIDAFAIWCTPGVAERLDARLCGNPTTPIELAAEAIPHGYVPKVGPRQLSELDMRYGIKTPARIMVSDPNQRRRSRKVHSYVMPKSMDPAQFVRLDDLIFLPSPELTLLQLARILPEPELAVACSRFMACYGDGLDAERGFMPRRPLTGPRRLERFIAAGAGLKHMHSLERAFELAIPAVSSPLELAVGLMFSMPHARGGYGMGTPVSAALLPPDSPVRAGPGPVSGLFWPRLGAVISCDMRSAQERRAAEGCADIHRSALVELGIDEYVITREQACSPAVLDSVASCIIDSRALEPIRYSERFRQAQAALAYAIRELL